MPGQGKVMAKKQGCGSQLLGAIIVLGLICWGINSCVQRSDETRRAEEQRRNSLASDQRAEEDRIQAEEEAKAAAERQDFSRKSDATLVSQEYVRKFLKFPDDADFGFWTVPDVRSNLAGDTFNVESTVKAKNGFGAQLTYRWQTIVFLDGGTMQLVACVIDGETVYESTELLAKIKEHKATPTLSQTLDEQNKLAIDAQREADIEAAKWRTWTSANGKHKMEAKFRKFVAGTLTLEKKDGTTGEVKLDSLCAEDQEFVRKQKWKRLANTGSGGGPSAEVLRARVVPFTTAEGTQAEMVLVDWKNTGTTTIRAVDADIIPYDAHGNKLESGANNYTIFAVSDSSPGVASGEKYTEPNGEGFTLAPGFGKANRVEVIITEVVETGAY
jgi:hypothetical protein